MVGRDAELARLLEAFERAESGVAQVAVVTGEAGIGKTRLVREFVARLPQGAVIAFGHAVPLASGAAPYGVMADLLRSLVLEVGMEVIREKLADRTEVLASLVPRLGVGTEGPVDRLAVFAAAQDLLTDVAAERILLLVVEDAHWADDSSLELMTLLLRTLIRGRLMFLVTSRSRSVEDTVLRSVSELRRLPNATAVEVGPLGLDAIAEQVAAIESTAGHDDLDEIARLSDGIPLYVEELLSGGPASPQSSLRLDLSSRLTSLTVPAAGLLKLAALEARPFRSDVLADASGRDLGEVEALLDDGWQAGLVEPVGSGWRFHHELLRLSTVATQGPAELREGHRRWATALTSMPERAPEDLVAAADHADGGLSPAEALAVRVLAARACEAVAHGTVSAAQWQDVLARVRAGEGVISEDEHEEALFGATGVSGWRHALDLANAEAMSRTGPGEMRDIWVKLTRLNAAWSLNEPPAVELSPEDLAMMMDRVASAPPRAFTMLLLRNLSQTYRYLDDLERAERAIDLAMEMAKRLPTLPSGFTGWMFEERLANLDRRSEGIEAFWEVVQEALDAIGDDDVESRALMHARAAAAHHQRGRFMEGVQQAQVAAELAGSPELSGFVWHIAVGTGQELNWYAGRWDEALHQSQLLMIPGFVESVNSAVFVSFIIAVHRGEPCDAELAIGSLESPQLSAHDGSTGFATRHYPALMEALAAERANPARALAALAPCLDDSDLRIHHHVPVILTLAARLAAFAPGPTEYRRRVSEAVARALDATPFEGTFARYVDADLDHAAGADAPATWAELVASCEQMPMPWYAGWARLRWADSLVRAGDRETAANVLASALTGAEELGARPLADDIRALASRARLRLPGHEHTGGPGPLTAREHEVLQLLVQGMTNDQIGSALFMSPRTASVHVSHILTKLQASNRTEVAAVAHRRGLVTGD
jgi:DNA-binding CsgD family transcriptional regulator